MENKHSRFRASIPFIILVALIATTIVVSFSRFMINQDYLIAYEGVCDPSIEKCFVGCEDEECTLEYYYSKVRKYAPDLRRQCGDDVTNCESANICLEYDRECSVDYCETEMGDENCSVFTDKLEGGEDMGVEADTQEESFEDNDISQTSI